MNGFDSYYKFTREKVIDICCVGNGVKYHSLSYWSIVDDTGRIFDRLIWRQTGMKSPFKWHNQPDKKKKNKELLECLVCTQTACCKIALNVGGKLRKIAFPLVLQQSCTFSLPVLLYLNGHFSLSRGVHSQNL